MRLNIRSIALLASTLAAAYAPVLSSASADELPGDGKSIRYAQSDSLGANYVVAKIMTKGFEALGYKVKLSTVNTTLFFQAAAQGDLDLATDINFPQREPGFRKVADKADMIGQGLIQGGGINGYLIDKKTADAYNIKTLEQMKDPKIAALFGTDGKAELINCDPGWSCGDVVEYQLDKFGLKDTVKSVRGKYEALMVEAVARAKRGEPVFFYAWSPSWMNKALQPGKDVVWLPTPFDALPEGVPNKGTNAVPNVEGCAAGANPCRMAMAAWNWNSVANKDFIKDNPAVKAFVEQASFPLSTWSTWEETISQKGGSEATIRGLSDAWLTENKALLDGWVAAAKSAH